MSVNSKLLTASSGAKMPSSFTTFSSTPRTLPPATCSTTSSFSSFLPLIMPPAAAAFALDFLDSSSLAASAVSCFLSSASPTIAAPTCVPPPAPAPATKWSSTMLFQPHGSIGRKTRAVSSRYAGLLPIGCRTCWAPCTSTESTQKLPAGGPAPPTSAPPPKVDAPNVFAQKRTCTMPLANVFRSDHQYASLTICRGVSWKQRNSGSGMIARMRSSFSLISSQLKCPVLWSKCDPCKISCSTHRPRCFDSHCRYRWLSAASEL
mmetsp:Transcript_9043/g.22117  ORF Transcript_9043/g.22117 Transcript_9043/m.22117 type:complete len:263 (-) Transcript_9043:728-1516(-)